MRALFKSEQLHMLLCLVRRGAASASLAMMADHLAVLYDFLSSYMIDVPKRLCVQCADKHTYSTA